VAVWLLDRGARIDDQSDNGFTALCWASHGGSLPLVSLLLERGADPTRAGTHGSTPLILATSNYSGECVRCLLSHPSVVASINSRGWSGTTALWSAAR
jgi:uncharacterized protein